MIMQALHIHDNCISNNTIRVLCWIQTTEWYLLACNCISFNHFDRHRYKTPVSPCFFIVLGQQIHYWSRNQAFFDKGHVIVSVASFGIRNDKCHPMTFDVIPGNTGLAHYSEVIMGAMASKITSLTIVYPTAYSGADQRKHQSTVSLAIVRAIHRWPVNSPHKLPVTRKMFPFDDVTMF